MASGNKKCKGCIAHDNSRMHCNLKPFYKNKECPCISCLVKGICNLTFENCAFLVKFSDEQILDYNPGQYIEVDW